MSASTPEAKARQRIDQMLEAAGWLVQNALDIELDAGPGVAVREFMLSTGPADYVLFVDGKAIGVVEAKPVGTTLSGVAGQSHKYLIGLPEHVQRHNDPLAFAYETTGKETFFRDERDPDYRSRRVFSFHRPETLRDWAAEAETFRARLRKLPPLSPQGLRDCQVEAITGLEASLAAARPRAVVQMATGSGKTYTAIAEVYRLLKFGGAKRVLFLVDRTNLGRQALNEFQQFVTPDDGRKFTELYNVQHLKGATLDSVANVVICTIQRAFSLLSGEALDEEAEEHSQFESSVANQPAKVVNYNAALPIETFDVVLIDECHRSIYNTWRQVLDYFDAFMIGLTATPSKQTLGFFNQNLVVEYSHERAVADNVNVGYDLYRIKTAIGEGGATVAGGEYVDKRDRVTRQVRLEQLDAELTYQASQLDRSVVAKDQIRTVIRTYKERLFTELFPGRTHVPKTLIFAKDDSHAEDIVEIVRDVFDKGNEFCKKITYRLTKEKPEDLLAAFKGSYYPRIVVTVDMIATGTDIRPLEAIIFMRDVKSSLYFEQMKGRGTRTVDPNELEAVTPDAGHKTHFVLVDAVGVTESDKTETQPLERDRSVPFEKLIVRIAQGDRTEKTLSTLANRLARLQTKLEPSDLKKIEEAAGKPLAQVIGGLVKAINPDAHVAKARAELADPEQEPTDEQVAQAAKALANEACAPFKPALRHVLTDIQKQLDQVIDNVTQDQVLLAGYDEDKAKVLVTNFKQFIEDNKDELTALQIIYNHSYGQRELTYDAIKEVAEAIGKAPYHLAPDHIWNAYARLEQGRVKGARPHKLLTDIISLVRFALGEAQTLEPYSDTVNRRYEEWLGQQGGRFTEYQLEWLELIKNHVAASLTIESDDFQEVPFSDKGGLFKVRQLFGADLDGIIKELNEVLVG